MGNVKTSLRANILPLRSARDFVDHVTKLGHSPEAIVLREPMFNSAPTRDIGKKIVLKIVRIRPVAIAAKF